MGPNLDTAAWDMQLAIEGARPEPLLGWAIDPHAWVDTASGCPMVTQTDQGDGMLEVWEGNCVQPDGTWIEGHLQWFDGPSGAWAAGENFSVTSEDGLQRHLDGAVEIVGDGALWLAEATATACSDCSNGTLTVDLAFTVFPAEGYPQDYDLTVSGVIAPPEDSGAIVVDGAWSIEDSTCSVEPSRGLFAIQRADHQTITLDGATACDSCAVWTVQGRDAPAYCGRIR